MGFWSRLGSALRLRGSDEAVGAELRDGWEQWGGSDSGINVNSLSAMQHSAVMACVSIVAGDIAKIPLGIFRGTPDGGMIRAKDHYLDRLLREPNPWQTAIEFKEMMQAALLLRGNAYAVALRNSRGLCTTLVPIFPDRVTVYEAPDGQWFYVVTRNGLHEMAVLRDMPLFIPAEDVLHIRWLSTWNSLLGSNRIQMMRQSVGLSMALEQHQATFTGRGARSGGVLTSDQKLTLEAREMLKSDWKAQREGPRNSGATTILEQGLKWQPLGLSMVDSQFIESRAFQIRDICRAFDVPPYKLAIEGEAEGPAMVQMSQEYLNGPISGHCGRWKASGEKFFGLDGYDLFLAWDYSHFVKADMVTRYTAYRQATGGAWMSVNEARLSEGMPAVEGGDDVLQPMNMAPLGWTPPDDTSPSGPGSDTTGAPAQGGDGDPDRDEGGDDPPEKEMTGHGETTRKYRRRRASRRAARIVAAN